jgi:hypothetical protein
MQDVQLKKAVVDVSVLVVSVFHPLLFFVASDFGVRFHDSCLMCAS